MIIVKIWGGLCNQMFQYAFGYALSKEKKDSLYYDINFYKNQPRYVDKRKLEIIDSFSLDNFDLVERPIGIEFFQNRYISFITRKFDYFRCSLPNGVKYIKEKEHVYRSHLPYYVGMTNYYDGYWQTEEYFKKYSNEIKRIFSPNISVVSNVQNSDLFLSNRDANTVAVHIRRGDQTGKIKGYSDEAMIKYYYNAMDYVKNKVDNPVFIIFSDDIEWCKMLFGGKSGRILFQDNSEWNVNHDLYGISLCNHGIMSASTFSWWGNWLGESEKRIVVAPQGEYFNNCFIPERWSLI